MRWIVHDIRASESKLFSRVWIRPFANDIIWVPAIDLHEKILPDLCDAGIYEAALLNEPLAILYLLHHNECQNRKNEKEQDTDPAKDPWEDINISVRIRACGNFIDKNPKDCPYGGKYCTDKAKHDFTNQNGTPFRF